MSCEFDPDDVEGRWWQEIDDNSTELNTPCDREVWEQEGETYNRCIWHVQKESKDSEEVREKLSEADAPIDFPYLVETNLSRADFSGKVCRYGNFSGADFREATVKQVSFDYSLFRGTKFSGLELSGVQFPNAIFDTAIMDRITCVNVNFSNASLDQAILVQSQLQTGVDISGASFDKTVFNGTVAEEESLTGFESTYEGEDWNKAAREYMRFMQVADASSLGNLRDEFYIKHKQAKRQGFPFLSRKRFFAGCSRFLFLYGERPSWAIAWSLGIIVLYIPLIACAGGIASNNSQVPLTVENASIYAYFSAVTFSTVGYGDYEPANSTAQIIAASEALLGAIMIALVVFALGRRATK